MDEGEDGGGAADAEGEGEDGGGGEDGGQPELSHGVAKIGEKIVSCRASQGFTKITSHRFPVNDVSTGLTVWSDLESFAGEEVSALDGSRR